MGFSFFSERGTGDLCAKQNQPYKVLRLGGRTFSIYLEFDEEHQESYPAYPDFEEHPEYTDDGRPFATAGQESCSYSKPAVLGNPPPSDCGGCGWFYREHTPYDPIGICVCDKRRREVKSEKKETE